MIEIERVGNPSVFVERLQGGVFERLDLHRANLRNQPLSNARFIDVSLIGAYLEGADFCEAEFTRCKFINARLVGSNCQGAIFDDCFLAFAVFERTNLRGANFSTSNFRMEVAGEGQDFHINLQDAVFDHSTLWPQWFDPLRFGGILVP